MDIQIELEANNPERNRMDRCEYTINLDVAFFYILCQSIPLLGQLLKLMNGILLD